MARIFKRYSLNSFIRDIRDRFPAKMMEMIVYADTLVRLLVFASVDNALRFYTCRTEIDQNAKL